MFDTVAEARSYIRDRWAFKGYAIGRFPQSAPEVVALPKPLNPDLVPSPLAEMAERISVSLEENAFATPISPDTVRNVPLDVQRNVIAALIDSGHVRQVPGFGVARYEVLHPFRAPVLQAEPPPPPFPLAIACPKCGELPYFRCTNKGGNTLVRVHDVRRDAFRALQSTAA